jgi:hypothetical protein
MGERREDKLMGTTADKEWALVVKRRRGVSQELWSADTVDMSSESLTIHKPTKKHEER